MDKIWDRKTSKSEVICRWGGDETQNRQKSNDNFFYMTGVYYPQSFNIFLMIILC